MNKTTIVWLRRDLRLSDQPALHHAIKRGGPVIPLFILSPDFQTMGAAAKWRLSQSLAALDHDLALIGSRLILRRGDPAEVLDQLITAHDAGGIVWSRCYGPTQIARDKAIKTDLKARGIQVQSVNACLLFEPWDVHTKQGGMFKVYSPFWRAVRDRHVGAPLGPVAHLPAPDIWPQSERLDDWDLGRAMDRGGAVVAQFTQAGERAAEMRLAAFLDDSIETYKDQRDFMDRQSTSGQSDHLSYGEMSPRTLWQAGQTALAKGRAGAEHFLKELVWREFAWHLMYHAPHIGHRNWRPEWDGFAWRADNDDAQAWRQARTGVPIVDAAMRELYVTGRMHNRARMITASYLTKHLLTDWRVGQAWFAQCLTDWDEASNAMGWQWVAGSGPDAAPYFRIFNPDLQAEKFDPKGLYRRRWLAEGDAQPTDTALAYFDAIPRRWNLSPAMEPASPVVSLAQGRARALQALQDTKTQQ